VEAPRRAGDPPKLIADPKQFRQSTDWQPQWTKMSDIIRHALEWEKKLKQ
jgi:UDP-glucose 4-epimerase